MKTLILNGSPRRNGDTAALISEMTKCLDGEVKVVSAYYDKISPCIDCRYCWEHDGCAVQDGMQEVYQAVKEFDNVVIASPIYYSQLTGELLSLASRFQRFYAARKFRGAAVENRRKNGALILVGGGDGSAEPALYMVNLLFKAMNANCVGSAMSLHTNEVPASQDEQAIAEAMELALCLNKLNGRVD